MSSVVMALMRRQREIRQELAALRPFVVELAQIDRAIAALDADERAAPALPVEEK